MIHGINVTLYRKQQTGEDAFGAPVFDEVSETVHNVLIGEPTTEELVNELQLYGSGSRTRWHCRKATRTTGTT